MALLIILLALFNLLHTALLYFVDFKKICWVTVFDFFDLSYPIGMDIGTIVLYGLGT